MLSIGEFSKLCRVSTKTLRHYDAIGLIKPKHINAENGYRYYDAAQLKRMVFIDKLKRYRFSLAEIAILMLAGDRDMLKAAIRKKKHELRSVMDAQQHILESMESDILKLERSMDIMQNNYKIELVETAPLNILSVRKMMGLKDFEAVFGELFGLVYGEKFSVCGVPLAIYHDKEFNPESSDIEVAVEVKESGKTGTRTLAGGTCCKTVFIGPYVDFTSAYAALGEWVEQEGYEVAAPPYERYIKGANDKVPPSEYVTDIYFPIKKK